MTGALIGFSLSAGIVLMVSGWVRTRRPSLEQRLLPYVRDVHPYAPVPGRSVGVMGAIFGPSARRLGDTIGDVLGGSAGVSRRLVRLDSPLTLDDFRLRQVAWGCAGFVGGAAVSAVSWSDRRGNVP